MFRCILLWGVIFSLGIHSSWAYQYYEDPQSDYQERKDRFFKIFEQAVKTRALSPAIIDRLVEMAQQLQNMAPEEERDFYQLRILAPIKALEHQRTQLSLEQCPLPFDTANFMAELYQDFQFSGEGSDGFGLSLGPALTTILQDERRQGDALSFSQKLIQLDRKISLSAFFLYTARYGHYSEIQSQELHFDYEKDIGELYRYLSLESPVEEMDQEYWRGFFRNLKVSSPQGKEFQRQVLELDQLKNRRDAEDLVDIDEAIKKTEQLQRERERLKAPLGGKKGGGVPRKSSTSILEQDADEELFPALKPQAPAVFDPYGLEARGKDVMPKPTQLGALDALFAYFLLSLNPSSMGGLKLSEAYLRQALDKLGIGDVESFTRELKTSVEGLKSEESPLSLPDGFERLRRKTVELLKQEEHVLPSGEKTDWETFLSLKLQHLGEAGAYLYQRLQQNVLLKQFFHQGPGGLGEEGSPLAKLSQLSFMDTLHALHQFRHSSGNLLKKIEGLKKQDPQSIIKHYLKYNPGVLQQVFKSHLSLKDTVCELAQEVSDEIKNRPVNDRWYQSYGLWLVAALTVVSLTVTMGGASPILALLWTSGLGFALGLPEAIYFSKESSALYEEADQLLMYFNVQGVGDSKMISRLIDQSQEKYFMALFTGVALSVDFCLFLRGLRLLKGQRAYQLLARSSRSVRHFQEAAQEVARQGGVQLYIKHQAKRELKWAQQVLGRPLAPEERLRFFHAMQVGQGELGQEGLELWQKVKRGEISRQALGLSPQASDDQVKHYLLKNGFEMSAEDPTSQQKFLTILLLSKNSSGKGLFSRNQAKRFLTLRREKLDIDQKIKRVIFASHHQHLAHKFKRVGESVVRKPGGLKGLFESALAGRLGWTRWLRGHDIQLSEFGRALMIGRIEKSLALEAPEATLKRFSPLIQRLEQAYDMAYRSVAQFKLLDDIVKRLKEGRTLTKLQNQKLQAMFPDVSDFTLKLDKIQAAAEAHHKMARHYGEIVARSRSEYSGLKNFAQWLAKNAEQESVRERSATFLKYMEEGRAHQGYRYRVRQETPRYVMRLPKDDGDLSRLLSHFKDSHHWQAKEYVWHELRFTLVEVLPDHLLQRLLAYLARVPGMHRVPGFLNILGMYRQRVVNMGELMNWARFHQMTQQHIDELVDMTNRKVGLLETFRANRSLRRHWEEMRAFLQKSTRDSDQEFLKRIEFVEKKITYRFEFTTAAFANHGLSWSMVRNLIWHESFWLGIEKSLGFEGLPTISEEILEAWEVPAGESGPQVEKTSQTPMDRDQFYETLLQGMMGDPAIREFLAHY